MKSSIPVLIMMLAASPCLAGKDLRSQAEIIYEFGGTPGDLVALLVQTAQLAQTNQTNSRSVFSARVEDIRTRDYPEIDESRLAGFLGNELLTPDLAAQWTEILFDTNIIVYWTIHEAKRHEFRGFMNRDNPFPRCTGQLVRSMMALREASHRNFDRTVSKWARLKPRVPSQLAELLDALLAVQIQLETEELPYFGDVVFNLSEIL